MNTIEQDLEMAEFWAQGVNHLETDGWRATCKRLADEVRRLQAQVTDFKVRVEAFDDILTHVEEAKEIPVGIIDEHHAEFVLNYLREIEHRLRELEGG